MKHFLLTILLFALLASAVFFNAKKVNEAAKTLESLLASLPASPAENACGEIEAYWESEKRFLSLSLNTSELERIDDIMGELCASCIVGDESAYGSAKEKLKKAFDSVDDGEKINFYGIF